ncbi:MAG TPA: bifunctional hydroxymethylpyrimidine kinase/phosphomethylpyrimidine kinase [Actinomycetota bacterium]|nr:bifunctional hydroxymethylpyrimidine kinase/phosphomethylpyrimidine kinase [Actinomycetota bacterium]
MAAPARPLENVPTALTIAGSDSGGGAGIQADLKVFMAFGCHGMSAVTALTAQNTTGVTGVHEVPAAFVVEQIHAVVSDLGVDAAKTGMLASAAIVEAVAEAVVVHRISPLVVDPVSVSKHGSRLLAEDAVDALKTLLLPHAALITPNLHEAEMLLGHSVNTLEEMKEAAREVADLGPEAVLVKGGHLQGEDSAVDVFFDGASVEELRGPRFDTQDTHGTGCVLAAAVTAGLAKGAGMAEAVADAKAFVAGAIERSLRLGSGYGPVNPGWRLS